MRICYGHIIFAMLALFLVFDAAADDIRIETTQKECQRIQKHVARNDVTYKPGVDVYGKPVTPADVNTTPTIQFDEIVIDLSLPLQDLFSAGNPPKDELKNAEVKVGTIRYDLLKGKFFFNGQELADPALNAIAEECQKKYGK
ncbi:hypothetical protein GUA87_12055 [Sneathiella sp. P13V-1]|uniref:hypothetical protein n=1 Tax=Sneathiella sp. P13V-1 TaxID=2697366 RepID=UPI00187B8EED|nr:hypothetical protein [Sneathiella sp. P13V-1]MBE7637582.1 hypothetical protein [Sneathiella sp. P13V-1]